MAGRQEDELRRVRSQVTEFSRLIQKRQAETKDAKEQVGRLGCCCLGSLLLGGVYLSGRITEGTFEERWLSGKLLD